MKKYVWDVTWLVQLPLKVTIATISNVSSRFVTGCDNMLEVWPILLSKL